MGRQGKSVWCEKSRPWPSPTISSGNGCISFFALRIGPHRREASASMFLHSTWSESDINGTRTTISYQDYLSQQHNVLILKIARIFLLSAESRVAIDFLTAQVACK